MKKIIILLYLIFSILAVNAAIYNSSQSGAWSNTATWGGSGVPGNGDRVVISHDVTINTNITIGESNEEGGEAAIRIQNSGTITLLSGIKLVCRGDLDASGNVTLEAGAILEMDASQATEPDSTVYIIEITPGNTNACLQINGTSMANCEVSANPGGAHTRITDGNETNGGRVVATFCNFSRLGGYPDYRAYQFRLSSAGDIFSFTDCTFDQCSQIKHRGHFSVPEGGYLEFIRCKWTNSHEKPDSLQGQWEEWDIFETWSEYGVTGKLIQCDFDKRVALHLAKDYEIEDCVFRDGIHSYTGEYWGGIRKSFKRNFVCWSQSGGRFNIDYGNDASDCIFIKNVPEDNNPHFGAIHDGSGPVNINGCVWWWNGTVSNAEGDGLMPRSADSLSREHNTITIENNIFLPSGLGPDGVNNLSCTGFTMLYESYNKQVVFKRNTIYVGNGAGGINLGETQLATTGDVAYVKSNLFIGGTGGNGTKVNDHGNCQTDVFLAENIDYNAGYRIANGELYGNGSGKGYDAFAFSGSNVVGPNDIDDVDPQFVDPTRTPASWTGSLDATMDRLSPGGGYSMQDLLDYIREGFRPQNEALRNAGDPEDGSPDIGAVDLSSLDAPSVPANLSATPVSISQIDLNWDASTGTEPVEGYYIYRDNVLVDSTIVTSYSDSGLETNTEYTYRVSAYDQSGDESDLSDPVTESTLNDTNPDEITFSIVNQEGTRNTEAVVPVIVQNFQDIATVQFSVKWNPNIISFVTTGNYAFSSLTSANFGTTLTNQGMLLFSWNKEGLEGESLNNNDTLFSMSFMLTGVEGDSSNIEITGDSLEIEVTNVQDDLLNVTVVSGTLSIVEGPPVTISGSVTNINMVSVEGAGIQLVGSDTSSIYTDGDGNYEFSVSSGEYELAFTEVENVTVQQDVTVADISSLRRHILGSELLNSPYKIVAGDVNFSDALSTRDIRYISDVILGVSSNFNEKTWKFVPAIHSFPDSTDPFPCPENWQYSNLQNDTTVDFIAVKLGDVDASFLSNQTKTSRVEKLNISIAPYTIEGNQLVIPFRAECSSDISGFQYTIEWDKNSLQFKSLEKTEFDITCNSNKITDGKLSMLWFQADGKGKTLNNDQLFDLKFDITGPVDREFPVRLTSSLTSSIAYDTRLKPIGIELLGITTEVQQLEVITDVSISPNPFRDNLEVKFSLTSNELVELTIVNVLGNIMDKFIVEGQPGNNNIRWHANGNIEPGVYFIRVKSNSINKVFSVNCQ